MPSILCFDSHGLFLRRLPLNVKNISVRDYCMIGGSPVPPYGPMRRLESCSNGWLFANRCSALFCVWKFSSRRLTHFLTSDVSQMKIFCLGLVIGNIYLVYR